MDRLAVSKLPEGPEWDLRNQARRLSARGRAERWSNDPLFPAPERLEQKVPLHRDRIEGPTGRHGH
jgi:hypothetical protein